MRGWKVWDEGRTLVEGKELVSDFWARWEPDDRERIKVGGGT